MFDFVNEGYKGSELRFVTLKEWAQAHSIDPATARQRANRGAFQTARKIGNLWIIDPNEPLIDHRKKTEH